MAETTAEYENISDYIPTDSALVKMAEFFSVFSDGTRIKILSALSLADLCVNELTELLKLNQSTVSHQLKQLKSCGIVEAKRQGKNMIYAIKNKRVFDVMLIGVENIKDSDKR